MRILFSILFFFLAESGFSNPGEPFPGDIEDAQLIYHPSSKSMLLLGGTTLIHDSVKSDVWKWDGKNWSKIEASGPGARVFFKGGLNARSGNIEMFAGAGLGRTNSFMKDLWVFDGKKWSKRTSTDIGSHDHHKMVYADHLNAFVLYGGSVDHSFDTVTWLMRDGVFTPLKIPGPGPRYQSGMVYDKNRKKVVLYGGGENPGEHWEFDGKKWERIITAVNPGVKLYHHMAYDEELKVVVLHGGQINHRRLDPENLKTPATWIWNGREWKKVAEEKIFAIAIGYHPVRKTVIAYGHNDGDERNARSLQLWELKNYKWERVADYGEWNSLAYLEQYLKASPGDQMALFAYASALRNSKRYAEAELAYKKIDREKIPQQANVWYGLIDVLKAQGKLDEAETSISRFEPIAEKRLIATMYYNLACSYALVGKPDKAFLNLDKAVKHGYNQKKNYEADADLESLRADERWKALLTKLE